MITVTLYFSSGEYHLKIDPRQNITSAFLILREKGMLPQMREPDFYFSTLRRRMVSAYRTFEEQEIYTGDKLWAIERNV